MTISLAYPGGCWDSLSMPHLDEHQALTQVSERLAARFPDLPVETVSSAVREAHGTFDGPVRDYVPVLVERAARERLASLASSTPISVQGVRS